MNNVEVGIIGGTGGIGQWFARFFKEQGLTVHVSGRTAGLPAAEMARRCDIVIVGVPISVTCDVIRLVGPLMKRESLLMDLTSLKAEPVKAMLESSTSDVIGLHPLFGPDVSSLDGQNIVLCPARGTTWLPQVKELFLSRGARLVEASPERHDELMAFVQGLTHLNTITMGLALRDAGIPQAELEKFSTPIFRTRLACIEKIFLKNPRLYSEVIASNPHTKKITALYGDALRRLEETVRKGKAEELKRLIEG
jgi:prephenate dehydrogenase